MIQIFKMSEMSKEDILRRNKEENDVSAVVSEIILRVREEGDAALRDYGARFDGIAPEMLEASEEERKAALAQAEPEFLAILREAAENIKTYHRPQLPQGYEIRKENGAILGRKITAIQKVGLYIPGGTASYPSSVLMNAIPAKLAGVREIVMVTPPDRSGAIHPNILAAAKIAGVDRIFKCGGAQAVAALAYGTESLPAVDKIVGPGNAYVAEAKRQVFGKVGIDMIAGPSEVLILADDKNRPEVLAADLLAQAEHDKLACPVLITDSEALAQAVAQAVEVQLQELPRREIARAAVENKGKIIIAESLEDAIAISNEIAPEHLEICLDQPFDYLEKITNAGSIFLGRDCPEPIGDYFGGTNHTLPTGGTARFSGGLSVEDFVKTSSYMYYSREALRQDAPKVRYFAEQEGLHAHAVSATIRLERESIEP